MNLKLLKAVKWSMVKLPAGASVEDLFRVALDTGFDGITLPAPGKYDLVEVLRAQDKTGIPIHNINVANHWQVRLSDPDPEVRAAALQETIDAIKFANDVGGSSILQVIGKVTDPEKENEKQVWERTTEQLRKAIPTAGRLGIRIACENVKNGFCYTISEWNKYIDQFDSPWIGTFFDIGNYDRFDGGAPAWIRALGTRVIKVDVKDHNHAEEKNCNLFEGNVDWPGVRAALVEINYHGWVTAEVRGGEAPRLKEIAANMDKALEIG